MGAAATECSQRDEGVRCKLGVLARRADWGDFVASKGDESGIGGGTAWLQQSRTIGEFEIRAHITEDSIMAGCLAEHAEGLSSYAVTKMTNGRMEGINRKIKTLLCQVYGFRDDDFLRLKLYALHESKHKLVG